MKGYHSMVGVLTSNTVRFGYATTIQGIEEAARSAGFLVAITVVPSDSATDIDAAVGLLLGQPLAGVVVLDFDIQGLQALEKLPDYLPIATVSSSMTGRAVSRVLFDDQRGGREATQYLLSLGHETVHYVAVPSTGRPSGRMKGWCDALREAHPDAAVPDVIETDWTSQSGYEAGIVLADRPGVTAVLCGNDEIAFGVMKAFQVCGLAVPGDVSVVGFDDHPHAALWTPSLTTMAQDFASLGRTAFAMLLADINGTKHMSDVSPVVHLVERGSTAPPRR